MNTTRVQETKCLGCGATLDAVSDVSSGAKSAPNPGDPIACLKCGGVATINDSGAICPFTEDQARELAADEGMLRELRRVVGAIHFLKAARN